MNISWVLACTVTVLWFVVWIVTTYTAIGQTGGCLDRGGRWVHEQTKCEATVPPP